MTDPLVSIVTPSLNHGRFIAATVASVLTQDHAEVEHLVVDGGSTDDTCRILDHVTVPPRKRLLWRSGPDGGQAEAVNRGMAAARGDILGWLNSDDVYAPGAIARAVDHFARHPDHLMVYGEAVWIDGDGQTVDRYPTLPPDGPIDRFQDGCFICQPTVFIRRAFLDRVGPLDAGLRLAMDMDWWLRAFRALPGRIGRIEAIQAGSRLHGGTKTETARVQVMAEGMTVLARHLGHSRPHWALTCLDDCLRAHPPAPAEVATSRDRRRLWRHMRGLLRPEDRRALLSRIRHDRRLALAGERLAVDVHPDGWAGQRVEIRVRRGWGPERLDLLCDHARPAASPLGIAVTTGGGPAGTVILAGGGAFRLRIDLEPATAVGAVERILLEADSVFVPRDVEPGSSDDRKLAFRIETASISPL